MQSNILLFAKLASIQYCLDCLTSTYRTFLEKQEKMAHGKQLLNRTKYKTNEMVNLTFLLFKTCKACILPSILSLLTTLIAAQRHFHTSYSSQLGQKTRQIS